MPLAWCVSQCPLHNWRVFSLLLLFVACGVVCVWVLLWWLVNQQDTRTTWHCRNCCVTTWKRTALVLSPSHEGDSVTQLLFGKLGNGQRCAQWVEPFCGQWDTIRCGTNSCLSDLFDHVDERRNPKRDGREACAAMSYTYSPKQSSKWQPCWM